MKSFFKNWKTSIAGIGVLLGLASKISMMGFDPSSDILTGISAVGLIFAKDGNVTGGTVQQFPTLTPPSTATTKPAQKVVQDPNAPKP